MKTVCAISLTGQTNWPDQNNSHPLDGSGNFAGPGNGTKPALFSSASAAEEFAAGIRVRIDGHTYRLGAVTVEEFVE